MSKAEQQINKWFSNFEHRFHSAVPTIIAETAVEFFQDTFKKQAWDGVPWQPLSAKYNAKKTRGKGRILRSSGAMQSTIKPSIVSANRVRISAGNAQVPYARAHNEGLHIKGTYKVRSYVNSNFMGKGRRVQVKQHNRTVNYKMPRRQFMGHSKFLNQQLITRLTNAFNT